MATPTAGAAAKEAALAGPGAGPSAARAVVAVAAATRTAQAIFLISIANGRVGGARVGTEAARAAEETRELDSGLASLF
ncbi:unnamed protein product, partial [Musa acuminata subsp. malaccensis]